MHRRRRRVDHDRSRRGRCIGTAAALDRLPIRTPARPSAALLLSSLEHVAGSLISDPARNSQNRIESGHAVDDSEKEFRIWRDARLRRAATMIRNGPLERRMPRAVDSTDDVVLDRLQTTLSSAMRDPSHSLASMMTEAYRNLLRVAHVQRGALGASPTLSTTALVHEVYLKLQESPELKVSDVKHFYYLATRAMRFVLTDHARRKLARKRGSALSTDLLDEHAVPDLDGRHAEQVVEINDVIDQLGQIFPRMAQIVSLRFYVGLDDAEIGSALGIDERTVRRDWIKARGWMIGRLREAD
ncbi:MAG TPA: ECF-type sigma factor [Dokdonella sp.]|nr:ECF-type sigma factor [Dokdonella sp.]